MVSEKFIFEQLGHFPAEEQVRFLMEALALMKKDNRRAEADCIALAMRLPLFPKVSGVLEIEAYSVRLLFDTDERGWVDFSRLLNSGKWFEKLLLANYELFLKMEVKRGTIAWPKKGVPLAGPKDEDPAAYYEIDPSLLYECASLS